MAAGHHPVSPGSARHRSGFEFHACLAIGGYAAMFTQIACAGNALCDDRPGNNGGVPALRQLRIVSRRLQQLTSSKVAVGQYHRTWLHTEGGLPE